MRGRQSWQALAVVSSGVRSPVHLSASKLTVRESCAWQSAVLGQSADAGVLTVQPGRRSALLQIDARSVSQNRSCRRTAGIVTRDGRCHLEDGDGQQRATPGLQLGKVVLDRVGLQRERVDVLASEHVQRCMRLRRDAASRFVDLVLD